MARVEPRLHVVLIEPEIPHNTGAIARLCLATGSTLHLVGRLGFRIDDRQVRRAGLDYWEHVDIRQHLDWEAAQAELGAAPAYFLESDGPQIYTETRFPSNAALVFGSETRGLPPSLVRQSDRCFRIPIFDERVRSLNLATSVAIVLYEAIRQNAGTGVAGL